VAITRTEQPVRIPADRDLLDGDLVVPEGARAIVLFAHGSGSSRHSSRNRFVAGELQRTGLGTLLMDLLTADEERRDVITAEYRFNIELLARRLTAAIDWLAREPSTAPLGVGLFGASTGAAAALIAAAERPDRVRAVVSRGGRPDLACEALPRVAAPALLIVGGRDEPVISLNKDAYARLRCEKRLEIIAGATHLFEEPGALENVAQLARDWFLTHAAGCYS
jgi:putative phosphoribosyl transferase